MNVLTRIAEGETVPIYAPGLEYRLLHAVRQIKDANGDEVYVKPKSLAKFGSNQLVGTSYATVMDLPSGVVDETFVSTNAITHLSSSNAGDTQEIVVEGHTIDGSGNLTFSVQTVTLAGQTKTALTTPLARCTRAYNNGATDLAGDLYFYEDGTVTSGVPDTASEVHLIVKSTQNQSSKAATSTSQYDYWLLTGIDGSVNKKTSATVDIELQVRNKGKVFRTIFNFSLSSSGQSTAEYNLDPCIIIEPNSDVRLRAIASTTAVSVSGRIKGYLAIKRV